MACLTKCIYSGTIPDMTHVTCIIRTLFLSLKSFNITENRNQDALAWSLMCLDYKGSTVYVQREYYT